MRKQATLLLAFGAFPLPLWAAGGHYPVDDAAIVEPGDFQIEGWFTRVDGDDRELGFLPAWTPPGTRLELTVGYYRLREDGEDFNRFEPAAKWQLTPVAPGRIGMAASFAIGYQNDEWSDWLLNLPISYALSEHPLTLHVNTGWLRDHTDGNRDRVFWGAGFEWEGAERVALIGQLYRQGVDEQPEAQLGMRVAVNDTLEHLDLAAGRVLRDEKDWFFTFGITATF